MRSRVTALVAEDEGPAADDLRNLLRTGFGVAVVDMARDSSEVFRRVQQRNYDVVFLDVKMPGLNGIEVASVLRQFAVPPPFSLLDEPPATITFSCPGNKTCGAK